MTELSEQLARWDERWARQFPMRLTPGQKRRFLEELEQLLQARGFGTERVRRWRLLRNHNLLTRCERPAVIFMAHYDTPTIMPFWMSAIFGLVGHTRQIWGIVLLLALIYLPLYLPTGSTLFSGLLLAIDLLLLLTLVLFLIPNPRNREDNSSGVLGVMALAHWLQDKPALRERVQLLFVDNEEWGLLGSLAQKAQWEKEGHPYAEAAIVNLDCISRGEIPLLVHHGRDALAKRLLPYVRRHLPQAMTLNNGIIPLSDNYTFRHEGAVDVSFADRTLIPGGYYIPRIHTPRDKDFDPEHTGRLIAALTEFIEEEIWPSPSP